MSIGRLPFRRARFLRSGTVAPMALTCPLLRPLAMPVGKAQEVMTNDSVISMVKAGLPDSVIIAKIRASERKFDTSTDGLVKLKAAKVPDSVIEAMISGGAAAPAAAAADPMIAY